MKRAEWRDGMGAIGVLGTIFWAVACAICLKEGTPAVLPWSWGTLALACLLGRAGAVAGCEPRTVTFWWGIRVPFLLNLPLFWKRRTVSSSARVVLRRTGKGSDKHPRTVHSAWLVDGKETEVCYFADPVKGRREAERLAKALDLPLEDATDPPSILRREPGTLDVALRDMARVPQRRPPPEVVQVTREELGEAVVFERSWDRRKALRKMGGPLGALAVIAGILMFELILEPRFNRALAIGVGVVVGVLGVIAVSMIHVATERVRLIASPAFLRLERSSFLMFRKAEIPAGEIEELDVRLSRKNTGARVLSAISDRRLLEFGPGLRPQDLEWIREEILDVFVRRG